MTLYEEVERNNFITILLFLVFGIFYALVVAAFLVVVGIKLNILSFLVVFSITTIAIFLIVRYKGKNVVLNAVGAKEVKREEYPFLYHTVEGLAIAAGIPTPKAYVIESDALNAFATGFTPEDSCIVVTTGLIKKLNRVELEGVIAHEMAHIKCFDVRTMLTAATLGMVIGFLAEFGLRSFRIRGGGGRDRGGSLILLLIAIIFLMLSPILASIIMLAISRNREFAADAEGAMLTRYPPGLASALRKIADEYEKNYVEIEGVNDSTRHLFIFDPKRKLFDLFSTHPPIEERIERLMKM